MTHAHTPLTGAQFKPSTAMERLMAFQLDMANAENEKLRAALADYVEQVTRYINCHTYALPDATKARAALGGVE